MSDGGVVQVVLEGDQMTQHLEGYLNDCFSVNRQMPDGGVLDVVLEGRQLTQQLESYLNECCSVEYCRAMVHGILAAWEKLMFMASSVPDNKTELSHPLAKLESPEVSDSMTYKPPFGVQEQPMQKPAKRRRSSLPAWTGQFRVCSPGAGADDGFNWRKYGQKGILGFKEPRSYYRCSYRYTQNCPATKQIQRSEHDPSVYDVKYNGTHTCVKKSKGKSPHQTAEDIPANPYFDLHILQSFKTGLRVQTEGLPVGDQDAPSTSASACHLTPSFSTPSPLAEGGYAFSGSFSSLSSLITPTGVAADETGNPAWGEPFLLGHESLGADMAACSGVPSAPVDTAAVTAGMEFMDDALFDVDTDFTDLFSHELV